MITSSKDFIMHLANSIFLTQFPLPTHICIADKPICRSEQKRIYGVARNEAAEILCEVDAYPPPDSFKWSFNNTAETFEMPQSDYRIHSSRASSLSYTPVKVRLLWGISFCALALISVHMSCVCLAKVVLFYCFIRDKPHMALSHSESYE